MPAGKWNTNGLGQLVHRFYGGEFSWEEAEKKAIAFSFCVSLENFL
jgi:hypothetical protein